ncbi:MAG: hypothetical protein QOE28_231, partial [Solirubrobacteraceae bacterium]|nr:hypothetical protein [Solirubrobacteraceae bacterium]
MTRRRALAAAAFAVVGVLAWVGSSALAGPRPAQLGRMAAAGSVTLAASDDGGTALLRADHLVPGRSVSGTISLGNVGESGGELSLVQTALDDVQGRGGGVLSRALVLDVDRLGSAAGRVYHGPLAGQPALDLGLFPAGGSRTYRLTLTLPDTGRPPGPLSGDNALMGASVTVGWLWGTETAGPATTPTAAATPGPGSTPAPA